MTRDGIRIHEPEDFAGMHAQARSPRACSTRLPSIVTVGVTTETLDDFITPVGEEGATSATIGYKGYAHASCISVNHVVCHGIPGAPIPKSAEETVATRPREAPRDDGLKTATSSTSTSP